MSDALLEVMRLEVHYAHAAVSRRFTPGQRLPFYVRLIEARVALPAGERAELSRFYAHVAHLLAREARPTPPV